MEAIEQTEINEVWRSIDGYITYQVSNIGRVRNCSTGKILSPFLSRKGYCMVDFHDGHGVRKRFRVHQLVAQEFLDRPDLGQALRVDHIDRNRVNNQVSNLRYATDSQNGANRTKKANTSSTYRGVCWDSTRKKWRVDIMQNYRRNHIGYYDDEREAARAYNARAHELFGEFANLNEIMT